MKKLLGLALVVLFILPASAQRNVEVKWGATYKRPSKTRVSEIIGRDKDGFYALRTHQMGARKGLWLERYDNKMALKFSEEIIVPKRGKEKLIYEGIFYIKGQLVLLTSLSNKKSGVSYAFAYPISKTGKVGTKFKKLDEVKMDGRRTGTFDFVLSKDSTKMLVYHDNPFDKYNNEKFSYKVYDNTLNIVWEKELQLPYKDRYFSVEDYIVDNEGNVFMRAEIYPDRSQGEKTTRHKQAEKFVILSYKHKTDEISQYEVKLSDKWVKSISYDVNENTNKIVVGGFYADDRKMQVKGIFYLAMDIASGNIDVASKKEFDKSFMEDMLGERKAEKGKGLTDFFFDHFLVKKDGGAYLIAEKYYITVTTSTDANGNTTTRTTYHYDDIIVVSVGASGEIDWVRKVPKRSGASTGFYLSYGLNFNKQTNELNIFFSDNPKNIEYMKENPNKAKSVGNVKKAVAMLVNINEEGHMVRSPMFKTKELDKIVIRPTLCLEVSDTEVITFAVKGGNYKFGSFSFK